MTDTLSFPGRDPEDCEQERLVDLADEIHGLILAAEVCCDAMTPPLEGAQADRALMTLFPVLRRRVRELAEGIGRLRAEGLRDA